MTVSRRSGARIARSVAAVVTAITLMAVAAGTLSISALGAWQDKEWVNAPVGVRVPRDCVTPGLYASEGGGQMLGGRLLGTDLAAIALVRGITAVNTGAGSSSVPARGPVAPDTYADPLDATAISAIDVALGNGIQLSLPAGAAGLYNQWGQAPSTGRSAGAAGLVSNSGAIGLTGTSADANLPDAATITPSTLLPAVAGLADATIRVGAVASSSSLDWCRTLENRVSDPTAPAVVSRSYGIARLDVRSTSPTIAGVATGTAAAITALQTAINGLAGPTGLLSTSLANGLVARLAGNLGVLTQGTPVSTTTVTLDLAPVSALLTRTLTDGVVTINLADGTVNVRLDGLLGGVDGLNNLNPNTELVLNAGVVNQITARIGALLDAWSTLVVSTATTAVDAATVTSTTAIPLTLAGLPVATVTASLTGTLGQVRTGTATVTASAAILPGLTVLTQNAVNPILATLTSTALNAANRLLMATGVAGAVGPVVTTVLTTFGTSVAATTAPVVTAMSALFSGLSRVLSLGVNVQPDRANAPPTPTARPGEYQVSALRVRLVDAGVDAAAVWLARSWAGPDAEV